MNDVEEALLAYQLMNLEFKMTPEELDTVMKTNIQRITLLRNAIIKRESLLILI